MNQTDFLDLNTVAKVDTYDLFELLGMRGMKPEDQASVVMDLQMLIWSSFLTQRLPLLLTQSQMQTIQALLADQLPLEQILVKIESFVPNFKPLWLEFALDYKLQWVKQYWAGREKELSEQLNRTSEALKPKTETELQRAQRAMVLANANQWPDLIAFLKA